MRISSILRSFAAALLFILAACLQPRQAEASLRTELQLPYPILFVTQVPVRQDFTTIGSTFGNQSGEIDSAIRGGDLWIRYPDGTLRNLTAVAEYGMEGFQGANAIAVRDPAVHWSGEKAIFSMVIGAPTQQWQVTTQTWQLYEITGFLDPDGPITITKVPNQPENYNNIYPIYGTDDRIIFVTDRPRSGEAHLYPQRDEYELAPTNTGLWSLNPTTGDLRLLNHAPSGNFSPILDSFGRVIFTQWDHLQRDQQADSDSNADEEINDCGSSPYGTFNYSDESASALKLGTNIEVFPEPRGCRTDLLEGTNLQGHSFNQFFPWQIREDGTDGEILNHLGRHEFGVYSAQGRTDDPNIIEFYRQYGVLFNQNPIYTGFFQIEEDPLHPGRYYGADMPEFGTYASGQVISMTAAPGTDADHIAITYVTHRDTYGTTPTANHSGHYREPLPLSDGTLIAVHTADTSEEADSGASIYEFRLNTLTIGANGYYAASQPLTPGISEAITYWDPDNWVSFSGLLWELNPVEVRPRSIPAAAPEGLETPELEMFSQAGVDPVEFQAWLTLNNLALAVTRNVTTRDDLDKQQPFNLRVPGGVQTVGESGTIYDVVFMQFFQADQLRGWSGCCSETPFPGRRVLAQPMHSVYQNPPSGAPQGGVTIAPDGSMAAFVPARRAMTWQLTDAEGVGMVRERYWITFQPGEIRVCTSCHGLSTVDQAGSQAPANSPQALFDLLLYWKEALAIPFTEKVFLPLASR